MTTASKQRTGNQPLQAGQQAFAADPPDAASRTEAQSRLKTTDTDNPPVLFQLPDVSDAVDHGTSSPEGADSREGFSSLEGVGSPAVDRPFASERSVHHSEPPAGQPPAPPPAEFPPPPAVAPGAVGDDFPPPPVYPPAQPFDTRSDADRTENPPVAGKERGSNAAAAPATNREGKPRRRSTSTAPAGRNWSETIGSRLLLLLLLAAVAAAAIFAGRGTDPADEIRLAGKPEDLLTELNAEDGKTDSALPATGQAPPHASDNGLEPPLSYEEFVARNEAEKGAARPSPTDPAGHAPERPGPYASAAAKATERVEASGAGTPQGSTDASTANAAPPEEIDAAEPAPRMAEAPTPQTRARQAISEPRAITEPQSNRLLDPPAASPAAGSEADLPVNPYDQHPYAAERVPRPSSAEMTAAGESAAAASSFGAERRAPGTPLPPYDRTETDQGVDWERLLPPNQPAGPRSAPGQEWPAEAPSSLGPGEGGLLPPANAPQPMQHDYAGPYPPGNLDPRYAPGMANADPAFGAQPGQVPPPSPQAYPARADNVYPRPSAIYPKPSAGGADPQGYGQPPIQQAISPYDPPRR